MSMVDDDGDPITPIECFVLNYNLA